MRILWLKTELLHPVDKGGRIRTYQMLRQLARRHEVTYLCLDDGGAAADAMERAAEYAHRVVRVPWQAPARGTAGFYLDLVRNLTSPLPYAVGKYRSPRFEAEVRRLAGEVDVVVCDFLAPAVNVPARLPAPVVLFQHNVEAEIWRRHAEVARQPLARRYFAGQWRRMQQFEAAACRRFSLVVAVSEPDAQLMRSAYGVERVTAVPTGVDLEYFRPQPEVARSRTELVFTGSMDWLPNAEGVAWFCEAVLPLVRQEIPAATLTIAGRNPSAAVRRLAEKHTGVAVTGTVPDVRPYLARGAALVVPLRIGGGTRLKIYEAMAMGTPVISTTVGAEGLPVTPDEHLVVTDAPEAFAAACIQALRGAPGARRMGLAGARYVQERFGWASVAEEFAAACEAVAREAASPEREQSAWR